MSQAKRPFSNIRAISRPISTSHFLEDVSSETPIFNIKRLKTIPPNIPVFRGCLKRNRHFEGNLSGQEREAPPLKACVRTYTDVHATRNACTWGVRRWACPNAQMVAMGSLCLVVASGCFGQMLRMARMHACAYVPVCACGM